MLHYGLSCEVFHSWIDQWLSFNLATQKTSVSTTWTSGAMTFYLLSQATPQSTYVNIQDTPRFRSYVFLFFFELPGDNIHILKQHVCVWIKIVSEKPTALPIATFWELDLQVAAITAFV